METKGMEKNIDGLEWRMRTRERGARGLDMNGDLDLDFLINRGSCVWRGMSE